MKNSFRLTGATIITDDGGQTLAALIDALSDFAWPALIAAVLWFSRSILSDIAANISLRIKSGAAIKTPWIEVDAVNVSTHTDLSSLPGISSKHDTEGREKEHSELYAQVRGIMLVHKLFPSTETGQLYDILVYVTHQNNYENFRKISKVEYYFGLGWPDTIFISTDQIRNFGIAISAYGPTLCTAKVVFNDNTSIMIYRYLDFEMGPFPLIS